jgi:plastocyanin
VSPTATPTPTAPAAQVHTVTIGNDFFRDSTSGNSTTSVPVGTTVEWDWSAGTHTTTSGPCPPCGGDGNWNSGLMSSGGKFQHTFTTAGSFPYFCGVHLQMMTGTINVTQ